MRSFEAVERRLGITGRYRIEGPIAEGGMGIVYRATQLSLDRPVALKVLKSQAARTPEAARRFLAEAHLAARISHPNVVRVLDSGAGAGGMYIVFELIEGESLRARMQRGLTPAQGLAFAIQACQGLEAVHQAGAVHRDVKPENLLGDREGTLWLTDLGIAKDLGPVVQTRTGMLFGTPAYMSPEQCCGDPVKPSSDLYSLGIVLYEIGTGATPFEESGPMEQIQAHIERVPEAPSSRNVRLPGQWDVTIGRLLSKDPRQRHASAAELRADLERLAAASSDPAPALLRSGQVSSGSKTRLARRSPTAAGSTKPPSGSSLELESTAPSSGSAMTEISASVSVPKRSSRAPQWVVVLVSLAALAAISRPSRTAPDRPVAEKPTRPQRAEPAMAAATGSTPVLVELPHATVALGRGDPPPALRLAYGPRAGKAVSMRIERRPGGWLGWAKLDASQAAGALLLAAGAFPQPRRIALARGPFPRFGEQLTTQSEDITIDFYPPVRGHVAQILGLGCGSLVLRKLHPPSKITRLLGKGAEGLWLDLWLTLESTPSNLADFDGWLEAVLPKMAPHLSCVGLSRSINTGGWLEAPEKLGDLVEHVRGIVARLAPKAKVVPGSLGLPDVQGPPRPERWLALGQWRQASRLHLRVPDVGGPWTQRLDECRSAARAAGLGELAWDVTLDKLPPQRMVTRRAAGSSMPDDIQLIALLRACTQAAAAGVDRIFLSSLREIGQAPILVDIFAGAMGGSKETPGQGANPLRLLMSRLSEVRPGAARPPPPGVLGAEFRLPNRRLWCLWTDGARPLEIGLRVSTPAAVVTALAPASRWARPVAPPVSLASAKDGAVAVSIGEAPVLVEEVP